MLHLDFFVPLLKSFDISKTLVNFAGTKQTKGLRSLKKPLGFTQVTKSHFVFCQVIILNQTKILPKIKRKN